MDESKVEEFIGQLAGHMTGARCALRLAGRRARATTGRWPALGGSAADEVAAKGLQPAAHPRVARQPGRGRDGRVRRGADTYAMSDEVAMVLADETAPAFMARGHEHVRVDVRSTGTGLADAFRGDGALSWGDHHPCLFRGTEWFFRPGYRAFLTDRVDPRARRGRASGSRGRARRRRRLRARRVGRGDGRGVPELDDPSGSTSTLRRSTTRRERAERSRGHEPTEFEVAGAKEYAGELRPHLLLRLPPRHGRPGGHRRGTRASTSAPGGTVLLVEPMALDDRATNIAENPLAALLYTASSAICTPNSLSQEVGLGLGAQAGEARLREVFEEAGLHPLPACDRDAAEHDPRGPRLNPGFWRQKRPPEAPFLTPKLLWRGVRVSRWAWGTMRM